MKRADTFQGTYRDGIARIPESDQPPHRYSAREGCQICEDEQKMAGDRQRGGPGEGILPCESAPVTAPLSAQFNLGRDGESARGVEFATEAHREPPGAKLPEFLTTDEHG